MSYIEDNLGNGEKIVMEGKVHPVKIFPHFINFFTTKLAVTNKNVIGKVGFIKKAACNIPLNKVNGVTINQGIFGKVFGYGTITITSMSDTFRFPYISKADKLKKTILNQMEIFEDEKIKKQAAEMANAIRG